MVLGNRTEGVRKWSRRCGEGERGLALSRDQSDTSTVIMPHSAKRLVFKIG